MIHFRRTATVDTEVRGVPIAAGDKVVVWLMAAQPRRAQFADPHRFDLTRRAEPARGLRRGGPHFCLGAHLAKPEVTVMFEELLPRLGSIELAGPARRIQSNFTNALRTMPVRVATA